MARAETVTNDLTQVPPAERNFAARKTRPDIVTRTIHFRWKLPVTRGPEGLRTINPATGELMQDTVRRFPNKEQAESFERLEEDALTHETPLRQVACSIPNCLSLEYFGIALATHERDSETVEFESLLPPGLSQETSEQIAKDLNNLIEQNPNTRINLTDTQILEKIFKEDKEFPFKPLPILERPLPYGVFFPELLIGGWRGRKDLLPILLSETPQILNSQIFVREKSRQTPVEAKSLQPEQQSQSLTLSVEDHKRARKEIKPASSIPQVPLISVENLPANREKQTTMELPTHMLATQGLTLSVEKPAQNSTTVENRIVSPVVEVESLNEVIPLEPVVEVGQELVGIIVEEGMVKKEVIEEATTIPLIEIPAPQGTENNLQIQTQGIEVEIEPVDKNQTGINEMLAEITQPASQEIEKEEIQEDVGPIEQKEPKILAVKRFKTDYFDISIYEGDKPEEGVRVQKLVWIVENIEERAQSAILELELPKDPNQRLYAFLHFLRQVVAEKFGEDIVRRRQIAMIRADGQPDEPLEIFDEISYYLSLFKQEDYAQVFAFIS